MMYRAGLFCILLLLAVFTATAQQQYPFNLYDTSKVMIWINPLGLLDVFDENLSVGGEYRLNATWSVTMDAAWIFYSAYQENTKKTNGLIVRPGVRAYMGRFKDSYVDFQLHYKSAMYHIEDWVGRDLVNGVAAYDQKTRYRYRKQVMGAQVLLGNKRELLNGRFSIECYIGIGLRYREEGLYHETNITIPARSNTVTIGPFNEHFQPAVPMGIRLVYPIR